VAKILIIDDQEQTIELFSLELSEQGQEESIIGPGLGPPSYSDFFTARR
jgi:hypothetical protein